MGRNSYQDGAKLKANGERANATAMVFIPTETVKSILESGRGTKEMATAHIFRMVKNMSEDGNDEAGLLMTHRPPNLAITGLRIIFRLK